jgi:hypothetical protein
MRRISLPAIKNIFLFVLLTGTGFSLFSQDDTFMSIHREQSEYYKAEPWPEISVSPAREASFDTCTLDKMVFGYHPYWMDDSYLGYHWNLLSDLCFFSYEVDASTGNPVTTHNWLTAPVVDSALANNVRVHLCVTLFSGHATFFSN